MLGGWRRLGERGGVRVRGGRESECEGEKGVEGCVERGGREGGWG